MEDYQQRVIDERDELSEKHSKLKSFFGSTVFQGLNSDDKDLLQAQSSHMRSYLDILDMRIARFNQG